MKLRDGDQPLPVPNEARDVQSQVIEDIVARRQVGIERYGTALQPHNGRDALRDAYEEAIDLAMYLKQLILERDLAGDVQRELTEALQDKLVETVGSQMPPGYVWNLGKVTDGLLPLIADAEKRAAAAAIVAAANDVHMPYEIRMELHARAAALASPAPASQGEPTDCGCGVPGCVWGHGA